MFRSRCLPLLGLEEFEKSAKPELERRVGKQRQGIRLGSLRGKQNVLQNNAAALLRSYFADACRERAGSALLTPSTLYMRCPQTPAFMTNSPKLPAVWVSSHSIFPIFAL